MLTKYDHAKKYASIARKEWFATHVIDVKAAPECGVTVVDFHKPGTSCYAIRYIFAGHHVYVSGDLGSAVFNCTWQVKPTDLHWRDRWYIFEKLEASRQNDFSDYDSEVCVTTIRQTLLEQDKNGNNTRFPDGWDKVMRDDFRDLIHAAKQCTSYYFWARTIDELNEDGRIDALDPDWWEWLCGAGKVMPPTIVGIIEGLRIISEYLRGRDEKGENNG